MTTPPLFFFTVTHQLILRVPYAFNLLLDCLLLREAGVTMVNVVFLRLQHEESRRICSQALHPQLRSPGNECGLTPNNAIRNAGYLLRIIHRWYIAVKMDPSLHCLSNRTCSRSDRKHGERYSPSPLICLVLLHFLLRLLVHMPPAPIAPIT